MASFRFPLIARMSAFGLARWCTGALRLCRFGRTGDREREPLYVSVEPERQDQGHS